MIALHIKEKNVTLLTYFPIFDYYINLICLLKLSDVLDFNIDCQETLYLLIIWFISGAMKSIDFVFVKLKCPIFILERPYFKAM